MMNETADTLIRNSSQSFFFNSRHFVFRNPGVEIISFPSEEGEHSVTIHFTKLGNALTSLDKSPFGGFVLAPSATKAGIEQVVKTMLEYFHKNRIDAVTIRCFPETYAPDESFMVLEVLQASGFIIKYLDIAQLIHVSSSHDLGLNVHRKRRLKKCREKGFSFQQLTANSLNDAYQLIVESRERKGYPVTMTLPALAAMFDRFPEHYLLFGVFDNQVMIAASVAIRVNDRILHCFYIGDRLSYRSYSPVTLLMQGIYDFCSQRDFRLIDLGISTDKGEMNEGLFSFKKSLGCVASRKLTFHKNL